MNSHLRACATPRARQQRAASINGRAGRQANLAVIGFAIFVLAFSAGCTPQQPLQDHLVGNLGHIEFRKSDGRIDGVVIGAPHGLSEPQAAEFAAAFSNQTGAGLIVAYGFKAKRIPVLQPLVYTTPLTAAPGAGRQVASVYPEFRALPQNAIEGPLKVYVGVRSADSSRNLNRIEVATGGLSYDRR